MSYKQFTSIHFNYIPSNFQGMADELIFKDMNDNKLYKVSFPINEGWFKASLNNALPKNYDYIIGVVKGKFKSFAIVQGSKRVEYTKQDIDTENIIY